MQQYKILLSVAVTSLKYPLTVENGTLALSRGDVVVRDAIFSILETQPLERVMRPLYGTPDFIFNSVRDVAIVIERIRQGLETQLPYVNFDIQNSVADDGVVNVSIAYQIGTIPQPTINLQVVS